MRRAVLFVIGVLLLPLAAGAQRPEKIARVGLLSPFSASATALWHEAFRQGLRDLGWVEGKNITIEYRYAEGRDDRLASLAGDLVRLNVDAIVTTVTSDALAAKKATTTIPVVMASAGDPVGSGLVETLARPGGNVTGLSQIAPELAGKRLALLKEIAPGLSHVAAMWNPKDPSSALSWKEIQQPARDLGVQLQSLEVQRAADIDKAFQAATKARAGALVIMPNPVIVTNLKRVADAAAKRRLPSMFHLREFADAGGLAAYGVDRANMFRRAASYVDKILKGAKPADLPVEQPTKFELVINMKTAKALGLTIPQSVLLQANQLIE